MSKTPGLLSCGHSLDQLNDYLAAGKTPVNPTVEACPECQAALRSLARLNVFIDELVRHDSQANTDEDLKWLGSIFSNIALEARAGRDIPLEPAGLGASGTAPADLVDGTLVDELSQSEGAVIALIRSAGDELEGAIIGRCRLDGDVTDPGAEIRVDIRVTALWGPPLLELAQELRAKIQSTLAQHTQLKISGIDIAIVDIQRTEAEVVDD
ncbi:hypothetical protein FHU41_002567 [Psychromicrobium silvestre]|uniref:Asp23 family n=1 Tax=Psychromicrobium silvestre TaxID=1645614 RepID=A0A7Y9LVE9_9MICC|nr:hypothetical protein [Psychromicrobium silvestre]NYE96317.1 hypothetical protein [Psychromicrobium silvestre]